MQIRAYAAATDVRAMQELQSRIWPLGAHPGGLGWLLATDQLGDHTYVATDGDRVVGWVALPGGRELIASVEPRADPAIEALLAVAVEQESESELRLAIADDDVTLRRGAAHHGFVPGGDTTYGMWLAAAAAPADSAPGYSVRSVTPAEVPARVEIHRAAWRPADMPWQPEHRPTTDPAATSSFSEETYARCRATRLYDADFDLVAVAPDGSFAASCIAWLDPSTGVAEVEPMGVHPDHRRHGLAGALCGEIARRVAERGGAQVFINAGWPEGYPAPRAAYTKAGFRTVRRGQVYVRRTEP